jgi:YkoY family integral membrane protein
MPFGIEWADLLTIGLLVLLEAALSADNALVLAVLVLPLPPAQQKRALRYGIMGALGFRVIATFFAAYLIHWNWVKLIGAAYLLYLPIKHFWSHPDQPTPGPARPITTMFALSAFWSTVVRVELTDIVFAIDSLLVAVAMSRKLWVIITGGILGIITMRLLIGQLLDIVRRFPAIVEGAYIIVAWVGIKLLVEYAHGIHLIDWQIPRWLSITVMLVLLVASVIYAKGKERPGIKKAAGKAQDLVE